jgi:hypothetical protein
MSDSYEVGTRAWQPDSTEGWVPSEVEQKLVEGDKVRLVFRLNNGEVCTLSWDRLSYCSRMVSGQTGSLCIHRHFPLRKLFDGKQPHVACVPDLADSSLLPD